MKEISSSNFGILIAFVLPGFTALWGAAYLSPLLRLWLVGSGTTGPTVGGFLHVTLASIAAGLTASTVRWAVIDTIHHRTGLSQPAWDFSQLQEHFAAYKMLHEIHYKFYQFHGNALVSLMFAFTARRVHIGTWAAEFEWFDVGLLLLMAILFVGSRDTLRNYYARVDMLLGSPRRHVRRNCLLNRKKTPRRLNAKSPTCLGGILPNIKRRQKNEQAAQMLL